MTTTDENPAPRLYSHRRYTIYECQDCHPGVDSSYEKPLEVAIPSDDEELDYLCPRCGAAGLGAWPQTSSEYVLVYASSVERAR